MEELKKFFEDHTHVEKVWVNEKGEWFTAPHVYGELTEYSRSEVLGEAPEKKASKKDSAK